MHLSTTLHTGYFVAGLCTAAIAAIRVQLTSYMVSVLQVGHVKQRGKPKPADADAQQIAEQAYEELLDHIQEVPANYIIDDSK